jgi:hypothetical protein
MTSSAQMNAGGQNNDSQTFGNTSSNGSRQGTNEETLMANGPMAISENARVKAKYGEKAVPGGTEIIDFNIGVGVSSGHLTLAVPKIEVGGDKQDLLMRTLLKKHGEEIAINIGNTMVVNRGDVVGSYSVNSSAKLGDAGVGSSVSLTPGVSEKMMDNIQKNFDIGMAHQVVKWCNANPNGGFIDVPTNKDGYTRIAYDQKMVAELKENANERIQQLLYPKIRSSADSETPSQSVALVSGNESVNRQFEQARKGANGDINVAAVAVETISKAPGYKPDQDISVIQGKNGGMIVSQGQGDAALNLSVPQAKAGDFERVSAQIAQLPQTAQVAQQQEQPERARTM